MSTTPLAPALFTLHEVRMVKDLSGNSQRIVADCISATGEHLGRIELALILKRAPGFYDVHLCGRYRATRYALSAATGFAKKTLGLVSTRKSAVPPAKPKRGCK